MNRSGTTVASVVSALLALGVCGAASAHTAQSPTTQSQASQEQFDRDKVTLKDRVQEQIDSANANIDALKRLTQNEKGDVKKQHNDMSKQLSDQRDRLKKDLDKIDKASLNDWPGVRPVVERDIQAMNTDLTRVAAVTNLPLPQTGAANRQP